MAGAKSRAQRVQADLDSDIHGSASRGSVCGRVLHAAEADCGYDRARTRMGATGRNGG